MVIGWRCVDLALMSMSVAGDNDLAQSSWAV
jgi:hypothetical protein